MVKCSKCGGILSDGVDVCPDCGLKSGEVKSGGVGGKWILISSLVTIPTIVIALLLVGLLVLFFVVPLPYTATETYTVKEPYEAKESYIESEPYTDYKTTYENEAYVDDVCKNRAPSYDVDQGGWGEGYYRNYNLIYNNAESQAVTITTTIYFFDDDRYPYAMSDSVSDSSASDSVTKKTTLTSREKKTVNFQSDLRSDLYNPWVRWNYEADDIQECSKVTKYRSVPKTTTFTNYRDVTKYRTITKYKDVDKERKVTKYATLFNQWTGKVKYSYKEGEA